MHCSREHLGSQVPSGDNRDSPWGLFLIFGPQKVPIFVQGLHFLFIYGKLLPERGTAASIQH